jgi:hypothetical protein
MSFIKTYSTTFLTLGILFFTDSNNINLWKPFKFSALIIAIFTLLIYFLILAIPQAVIFLSQQNLFNTVFMVAEHKKTLYWWIPSVFHKASSILIIALGYYLYNYLYEKKGKGILGVIFYSFALFATGTRANILALLLVTFFIISYYSFYVKKRFLLSVCISLIGTICSLLLIYLLLFAVKNSSSIAKDGHLVSYIDLFLEDIRFFLFGQGPGSWFYTKGFHQYTTNTELSYLELIRMFGIFFTIIIICIYAYPLIMLLTMRTFLSFSIAISYLAYLFIAGTNPLLIGSTGFMTLAVAFYFKNHKKIVL